MNVYMFDCFAGYRIHSHMALEFASGVFWKIVFAEV